MTLKALTHWETGGIVAAGTTSLPEKIGGSRNWDYRFCWLRDATFTLLRLIGAGFFDGGEGVARVAAARGRRRTRTTCRSCTASPANDGLTEYGLPGCRDTKGSAPVRVGNAAFGQMQLDVYGEVLDALYVARVPARSPTRRLGPRSALVAHLETIWDEPDEGIWEVRGGRKHFTHSKVMAWVAFDRAVRSIEEFGLGRPARALARDPVDAIHDEVCDRGFDAALNSFVQSYGAKTLDASLLLIPMVGFLPPDDPRVRGTVAAIERDLVRDGLCAALRHRRRGPRTAAGRRRVPGLQLLAGGQLRAARPA